MSDKNENEDFDLILKELTEEFEKQQKEDEAAAAAEAARDARNPLLVKYPQCKELYKTLLEHGWEVELAVIESGILTIHKGAESYVLQLFDGGNGTNTWLGEEDKFRGNDPQWYSDESYTLSPVYAVNKYIKRLKSKKKRYLPIVVILPPHFVINAEDMIEIWGDTRIVTLERLCNIVRKDSMLTFKTKEKDIGVNPLRKSRQKAQEKSVAKESDASDDNSKETSLDTFEEVKISKVRYAIDLGRSDNTPTPSIATHFRAADNFILFFWIDIEGVSNTQSEYTVQLCDKRNKVINEDTFTFDRTSPTLSCINIDSKLDGQYWFYIRNNGKEVYSEKLTFIDVTSDISKLVQRDGFALYRIEERDDEGDHATMTARRPMSSFNYKGLAGILATPIFKNISGDHLLFEFILTIENEEGATIYESKNEGKLYTEEGIGYGVEVRGLVCAAGNYFVRVKFLGESMYECDFTVGEKDVTNSYRMSYVLPKVTGKNVIRETTDNPMELLESMIGLGKLKKQLKRSIAKIKLDQARKEQNLPIKAQQLHMAFLGNPGTGKTTVAKLLGQIYKEIGILSKGHVVMRERSSLSTQNWGGEGELVNQALQEAAGGILFIDEAYDLVTEHKTDPGKLIISHLLTAMADEKNRDFMVIFAGYTMPMERMLSKNPGLRSRLTSMYFDDYDVSELTQIADLWLDRNCYSLTSDARKYFESILRTAYASRNENFGNARYVINLLENEIQPSMAERVMAEEVLMAPFSRLTTIEASDIPNYHAEGNEAEQAIAKLEEMVGLNGLKKQIRSHLSYIRFMQTRRDNKIDTPIPPMHMVFTGNPGTGKSSVAGYLGDIYRSMGILSIGNVIKVTRADMIDSAIGGTEEKMKELLNTAHGNILFIDEAYTLFSKSGNDVGKNAVEVLLDALGKENMDMIVIMAGYPKEMDEMLAGMNPGLRGRFPYIFNFEDYDEDELFKIAEDEVKRNSLTLTNGAKEALKAMIRKECKTKDNNFSNARFVIRLITTQVLPNMAVRLEGESDPEKMKRILQRDIPIEYKQIRMINENLFDEETIEGALERLDAMVGLTKVKIAIHQFVDFARNINRKDPTQIERYPLKWNFVGNTGTGKSSVAEILSEILKAMHLLGKGHTVEVKADELYGVATYKADELMRERMLESLQGLLFVDGDAPLHQFVPPNAFSPDYLRACLAINTAEIHGRFAVVIAEQYSSKVSLAKSLNKIGISNFDQTLIFDDYTAEELMAILSSQLSKHDLSLSPDAATIMYSYITRLCAASGSDSEINARTMKELTRTIHNIASTRGYDCAVIPAEIVAMFATSQTPHTKIGY